MIRNIFYKSFVLMFVAFQAFSQEKPFSPGNCSSLLQDLKNQVETSIQNKRNTKLVITLNVSAAKAFKAKLNYKSIGTSNQHLIGEIENEPGSTFFLRIENNEALGRIILRDKKRAYKYYSDQQGKIFVEETDINNVLCIGLQKGSSPAIISKDAAQQIGPSVSNLESYPGANGCVLLDFDGQYVVNSHWNNGNPINAQPMSVTDAQVQEIWELVSEDYRPYKLNITTSESIYNSYPANRRMRCIFTPTNTASPGAGGVAYIGSFNWGDETPCWVFNGGVKGAGEAASHEVGHTFDLGHDGRVNPAEGYYGGQGNWAPIMGVGYYKSISQWSKGEYTSANNFQDDLSSIAASKFGVGYRNDDKGNTLASAFPLSYDASGNVAATANAGVIDRTGDIDMFSFTTTGGAVTLNFNPAARHADLDILATLYNSSGTILASSNPGGLSASINTTLAAGTYYVSVTGTGAGSPASDGYSNYASLGYYSISGNIKGSGTGGNSLALNKPVTTSSIETTGFEGAKAVDGSTATRWASVEGVDPQWIYVDLGATYNVNRVNIAWEAAYGKDYQVQISSDAIGWTTLKTITGNSNLNNDHTGLSGTGRYVRIYATARGTQWGYSIFELQVYGTQSAIVGATFYKDCNYNGTAVGLAPGSYTLAQLNAKGILNDDISSLKVASGYQAILYQNDNFTGNAYAFPFDYSCLVAVGLTNGTSVNLNDWTTSVVVQATSAKSAVARLEVSEKPYLLAKGNVSIETLSSIVIAPNPATDQIVVNFGNTDALLNTGLYTIDGHVVIPTRSIKSGSSIRIDQLKSGIYLMKIQLGHQMITRKIIKY